MRMNKNTEKLLELYPVKRLRHRLLLMVGIMPFSLFDDFFGVQSAGNTTMTKFINDQVEFNKSVIDEFEAIASFSHDDNDDYGVYG